MSHVVGTSATQPALSVKGVHGVVATTQRGVGALDGTEVYAQRLDAAGNALGLPVHVNQITLGDQSHPVAVVAADGSFVVSYLSGDAAYVRQFAADGTPLGAEQRVSNMLDHVSGTNVVKGTDGKFLVTYVTNNVATGNDVYSRLFNADGTPVGPAQLLNSNQVGDQIAPTAAALPGGQYVTAFQSNLGSGQGYDIVMQRLSDSGAMLGTNTIVNTVTSGDQVAPDVVYDAAHDQIALVYSTVNGMDTGDIGLQLFNADGSVKSPMEIVNTVRSGVQSAPKLGVTNRGTMAVSYITDRAGLNPTGTLTMLDGNGLLLGDTDLGALNNTADNIPLAGGATASMLTAVANGTNMSPEVSTQQVSIEPLQIFGTSQNDTVVVVPGVGSLTITINGVVTNPLIGDFSQITINTGAGQDSVTVANLLNLLGSIAVSVNGGTGDDTLTTGDTADTLIGDLGNDILNAGEGNDILDGGVGDDVLSGAAGADTLMGGIGNDSLDGGAGNDWLSDIAGTDSMTGGDGIDMVDFSAATSNLRISLSGQPVSGTIGQFDTLAADIENATGGSGSDTIIGNALSNLLYGGLGNDTLDGGLGSDVLDGGAGVDTVSCATRTTDLILSLNSAPTSGALGELDQINSTIENVFGGAGNDLIIGSGASNFIIGGAGNDTILGESGNDLINGDSGNDVVDGGDGRDTLGGGAGNDAIEGGHSSDVLEGDDGNDILTGGPGRDTLEGGNGNDRVKAGSGNDYITGGGGVDSLYGDTGDDSISGGNDNDVIQGNTGNDTLDGDGGDDRLYGGTGIDYLDGGEGANRLDGGPSRDFAYVSDKDTVISAQVLS